MDFNSTMVSGRVCGPFRKKITSGGDESCTFILKSERCDGTVDLIDCAAKGNVAKRLISFFEEGKRISIRGSIQTRIVSDVDKKAKRTEILLHTFYEENEGNE